MAKTVRPVSFTWVVGSESEHDVTVIGHSYRVLGRRQVEVPVQETSPIQVERVFQVDLLHVLVGRPSHTDHVERITVQMERMAQVRLLDWMRVKNCFFFKRKTSVNTYDLFIFYCFFFGGLISRNYLTFVDQHDLDYGMHGDVYLVRAHAIPAAVGGFVVAVAEHLRRYVIDLRQHRRRRRGVRDFVNQTDNVVSATGSDWGKNERKNKHKKHVYAYKNRIQESES